METDGDWSPSLRPAPLWAEDHLRDPPPAANRRELLAVTDGTDGQWAAPSRGGEHRLPSLPRPLPPSLPLHLLHRPSPERGAGEAQSAFLKKMEPIQRPAGANRPAALLCAEVREGKQLNTEEDVTGELYSKTKKCGTLFYWQTAFVVF